MECKQFLNKPVIVDIVIIDEVVVAKLPLVDNKGHLKGRGRVSETTKKNKPQLELRKDFRELETSQDDSHIFLL